MQESMEGAIATESELIKTLVRIGQKYKEKFELLN